MAKKKATTVSVKDRLRALYQLQMIDSEIDKMVNEAKKHESEDKDKREKIDLINQSEHLIYETEKNVKEHADKLEESEKGDLDEKVKALTKAKMKMIVRIMTL